MHLKTHGDDELYLCISNIIYTRAHHETVFDYRVPIKYMTLYYVCSLNNNENTDLVVALYYVGRVIKLIIIVNLHYFLTGRGKGKANTSYYMV